MFAHKSLVTATAPTQNVVTMQVETVYAQLPSLLSLVLLPRSSVACDFIICTVVVQRSPGPGTGHGCAHMEYEDEL